MIKNRHQSGGGKSSVRGDSALHAASVINSGAPSGGESVRRINIVSGPGDKTIAKAIRKMKTAEVVGVI